jgi:hypothetical protein
MGWAEFADASCVAGWKHTPTMDWFGRCISVLKSSNSGIRRTLVERSNTIKASLSIMLRGYRFIIY